MKVKNRILVVLGCLAVVLIAWFAVITTQSAGARQAELLDEALDLMSKEIYVRAEPMLEEAAGINASKTIESEDALKKVYLHMITEQGYPRKYTTLLDKQMARKDASPDVFKEAAEYYFSTSKINSAITVLREGVRKTQDEELRALYEEKRYAFYTGRALYEDVTGLYKGKIQVANGGLWGMADSRGELLIPCEYKKVSTYGGSGVVVKGEGEVFAVNIANYRLYVPEKEIEDFGNLGDNIIPLLIGGKWVRGNIEFSSGTITYDEIGMYSGGYAAAKTGGKWGVVDLEGEWLVEPSYDEIIADELGRCYGQGVVFAKKGNSVYMILNGDVQGGQYEDARPFAENYAAVKKNGKWGFIDSTGTEKISCAYSDALSFGEHLAAVEIDGMWGYISLQGKIAIEPTFYKAKSFSNGTAPVLTDGGWSLITLYEYEENNNGL